ncbi:hypothetical protein MDAP_001696 [Mitosporidium daphniae]
MKHRSTVVAYVSLLLCGTLFCILFIFKHPQGIFFGEKVIVAEDGHILDNDSLNAKNTRFVPATMASSYLAFPIPYTEVFNFVSMNLFSSVSITILSSLLSIVVYFFLSKLINTAGSKLGIKSYEPPSEATFKFSKYTKALLFLPFPIIFAFILINFCLVNLEKPSQFAYLKVFEDHLKSHIVDYVYKFPEINLVLVAEALSSMPNRGIFIQLKSLLRQYAHVPFLKKALRYKVVEVISNEYSEDFFTVVDVFYKLNLTFMTTHISKISINTLPKLNTTLDQAYYQRILEKKFSNVNDTFSKSINTNATGKDIENRLVAWFSNISSTEKISVIKSILTNFTIDPNRLESLNPFFSPLLTGHPQLFPIFESIVNIPTFYFEIGTLPISTYFCFVQRLRELHLHVSFPYPSPPKKKPNT